MSKVLVVAAHPDDEVLGCGATLAAHAARGDTVDILLLADGESARGAGGTGIASREAAARAAAAALGARVPTLLSLPDNRIDSLPLLDVVQAVERVVDAVRPDIVYTHHAGDLNVDHRIAHLATMTACRPLPGGSVRAVYAFETLSSTEWGTPAAETAFVPVRFVDVRHTMAAKLAALGCYAGEMRPFPHARSFEAVQALATLRGASVGVPAAEAFVVCREIEPAPAAETP